MKKHRKLAVCAVCAAAGVLVAVFAIRGGKPPAASIEAAGTENAAQQTASIEAVRDKLGADMITIEAQVYARSLYENLGFRQTSEEFLEDGIPHIQMQLEL